MQVRALGLVLIAVVIACADNALAPNTDVGLRVWVEVNPTALSIGDSLTPVSVRLYVLNPTSREIRVVSGGPPYRFTLDPVQTQGLWGSIRVACEEKPLNCGPNVDWWGDSVYVFPPRTKAYDELTFTLAEWRAGGWALTLRNYQVRGWFNGREGVHALFTLRQ